MPTPNSPCGNAWYILTMSSCTPANVSQITRITHARELCFFLIGSQAGEIIFGFLCRRCRSRLAWSASGASARNCFNNSGASRSGVFALAAAARVGIDDELVDAEGFFVEENPGAHAQRRIQILAQILAGTTKRRCQVLRSRLWRPRCKAPGSRWKTFRRNRDGTCCPTRNSLRLACPPKSS